MSRSLPFLSASLLLGLLAGCNSETVANAPGKAAPVIHDGSLMEPGKPQLTALPQTAAIGTQPVGWNMWWGENGSHWVMYVNGKEAQSGELHPETPKQQQGTAELLFDQPGSYEIKVSLCNDHGCSESEKAVLQVAAG